MASVQELIAAAQAQKSPFISLLEGATQGLGQGLAQGPSLVSKLIEMQQNKAADARADEMHKAIMGQITGNQESNTQAGLKKVGGAGTPSHGGVRLQLAGASLGADNRYKPRFEPVTPAYQTREYQDDAGKARIGLFDPKSPDNIIKSPNDPYAPRSQGATETPGRTRREFLALQEVKDYMNTSTQVASMDAILNDPTANKVAKDQALISMFNKLTDPQSVVRESEYARTPENLPIVNRMYGALAKVQSGGAGMTDEDREALVIAAKVIMNQRGRVFNERRQEYTDLAADLGFKPEIVIGKRPAFTPYAVPTAAGAPAAQAVAAAAPRRVGKYTYTVRD